jgi:hypothetical protein
MLVNNEYNIIVILTLTTILLLLLSKIKIYI